MNDNKAKNVKRNGEKLRIRKPRSVKLFMKLVEKKHEVLGITIFVNLGRFRHFETVTNIRTWIKSHMYIGECCKVQIL